MTMFGWVGEKALGSLRSPLGNAGILRCAQNDDVKRTTARTTATARAKTKYRDLSTAAAKCAAFGRDDVCWGADREQATARTKATATATTTTTATAKVSGGRTRCSYPS